MQGISLLKHKLRFVERNFFCSPTVILKLTNYIYFTKDIWLKLKERMFMQVSAKLFGKQIFIITYITTYTRILFVHVYKLGKPHEFHSTYKDQTPKITWLSSPFLLILLTNVGREKDQVTAIFSFTKSKPNKYCLTIVMA